MGSNNLTYVSGGTIVIAHPNQYYTAFNQDVVPRNSSGVVTTSGGSLGTSTYKWLDAFIAGTINVGATGNGNKITESSNNLIVQTASTTRMTITNAGLVGIGTTAPTEILHVLKGGTPQAGSSDTDELVLQNSAAAGDDCGMTIISGNTGYSAISFGDTDDSNAGQFWYDHADNEFKLQTTVASTAATLKLINQANDETGFSSSFSICSLNIEMYDDTSGLSLTNSLVQYTSGGWKWTFDSGANTASEKFTFTSSDAGSSDEDFLIENTDSTVSSVHTLLKLKYTNEDLDSLSTGAAQWASFVDNTGTRGAIGWDSTANVVVYGGASDRRLKEDLKDFNGLGIVNKIGVYDFKWKDSGKRSYGFLAQDYYEKIYNTVFPEDHPETLMLDYGKMTPYLWKAVQELSKRVEELEKQ